MTGAKGQSGSALDYLCSLDHVPMVLNGNLPIRASNSERRRWLESRSVEINGLRPAPRDAIQYPITSLVFFPRSPRRTTML